MELAVRIITVLLQILNSENVEFVGLKGQGVRNIASVIAQAEQFVSENTPEEGAAPAEIEVEETE